MKLVMNNRVSGLNAKLADLRQTFVAQLPTRMADAQALLDTLHSHPDDKEALRNLHRNWHTIKGTSATFGLAPLSALAGEGEEWVKLLLNKPAGLNPHELEPLNACMLRMTQWLEQPEARQIEKPAPPEPELAADVTVPQPAAKAAASNGENDPVRLVYICDDEVLEAEQLGAQLQCFGYRTELFNNTADLLRRARQSPPDVIVMDIMFPDNESAGTQCLAELRDIHGLFIPAIFTSSRRDFDARLQAIRAGGEAYFPKPVPALELVSALDLLTRQAVPEPFRILIVDDEPAVAQYHALILQNAGMITEITRDLPKVLDVVSEFRPDMVLMDMYMPGALGQEVAKLIRQMPEFLSLPIVYLSSETDRAKQFSAMRVGVEEFLTKPIQAEALVAAVELRAERTRTLRSLMSHDSLTGLLNHTTTTQFLLHNIITARRQNGHFCFAMLDVDRFKSVNDTYGHLSGDQVLLALARVLQQRLRNSDVVGRYGGEEFAIILNDMSLENARLIIDELRDDFSKIIFNSGKTSFSCTFSCGIAAYPRFTTMESLREAADKAMYRAKHAGRNQVMVSEE